MGTRVFSSVPSAKVRRPRLMLGKVEGWVGDCEGDAEDRWSHGH